ncbi:MAG: prephenate dehydrogenase [bacterium]
MKKISFAIIGYGRFGELFAKILAPFGNVLIVSKRKIKGVRQIKYNDLKNIDVVIPTVPISKFEEVIKKIAPHLKKKSLVMDVCSVKEIPCKIMKKYIPKSIEILGTHPMFGPDSTKNGLCGLQIAICPLRISKGTMSRTQKMFKKMGLKIIGTTPREHDRQAAKCLALVHFLGRGLAKAIKKQNITSLGYERLLAVNETVNNDTWQLFFDMQHFNPYSARERKKFIQELKKIDQKIVDNKNIININIKFKNKRKT